MLCPKLEGKWVLASAERNAVHVFESEHIASSFRDALDLNSAFMDCLGRNETPHKPIFAHGTF